MQQKYNDINSWLFSEIFLHPCDAQICLSILMIVIANKTLKTATSSHISNEAYNGRSALCPLLLVLESDTINCVHIRLTKICRDFGCIFSIYFAFCSSKPFYFISRLNLSWVLELHELSAEITCVRIKNHQQKLLTCCGQI